MASDPRSTISSFGSGTYPDSGYAPSAGSLPKQRKQSPSPLPPSLQNILSSPRILDYILSLVSYGDFFALTATCSELRDLMQEPALKDAILSHFLPGFRSLLRTKTPELFVDVRVTVGDLNVFREPPLPSIFDSCP
jgi:hypothetical protein